MGLTADIAAFVARLDAAIDSTMQGPVLDGAKKQLRASAYSEVYGAYSPEFFSRRMDGGGLADMSLMEHAYEDKTLLITDEAPWQQLYGGTPASGLLADAIARGDARYHFQNAGPRPFHEEAEREFAANGEFERLLAAGLRAHGFTVH